MNLNFQMTDKVVVVTGGCGLLGLQHCRALTLVGAVPVVLDYNIPSDFPYEALKCDITNEDDVSTCYSNILNNHKRLDVLINNAARNPKMDVTNPYNGRIEEIDLDAWEIDLKVSLTGAMICCKIFGSHMANAGKGVILNISSDLGIIAPDQRIYENSGLSDDKQPVKPLSYSVVKHGLIGLTKYIATYWADRGVRCNALCPGGVINNQSEKIIQNLVDRIPLKRLANVDEYHGAIQFMCSDASSYMNGSIIVVDGGRTCW